MSSLAWIQLTANGKSVPIRVDDIDRVYPVGGSVGGSQIHFKADTWLEVSETPAQVYTAIEAKYTAYLAALGDPT
jgi:hypothetical protein